MKSRLFRILAGIMAIVMMGTCLSACGKKGDDEANGPTKPGSIEAPSTNSVINFDDLLIDEPSTEEEPSTEAPTEAPTKGSGNSSNGGNSVTLPANNNSGTGSDIGTGTGSSQLSQEDVENIVRALGYEYDDEQKVFYSVLNPWQRHFGFGDAYDELAVYGNMRYTTIKIDFKYEGLLWRIQCWKGQYGILSGGEMGVYTKDPNDTESNFYECASDEHLLEMQFKFYKTVGDFNKKAPAFERKLQEHWWLTGFQFGYCDSRNCVMEMTLNARDKEMADGIENGLKNVTDKNGVWDGFVRYTGGAKGSDFYIRNGNTFKIIWVNAGYENYTARS